MYQSQTHQEEVVELQERALRITEALYRTTDLFSDSEPLKWSARESAIKILSAVSGIGPEADYEGAKELTRLEFLVSSLLVKLELAASGTFLAKQNFDVLKREYKALLGLSIGHLGIPVSQFLSIGQSDIKAKNIETPHIALASHAQAPVRAEVASSRQDLRGKDEKKEAPGLMLGRKEAILQWLQGRGPKSVGEVARSLGVGVSEKTIQRELHKLVDAGSLQREGQKRWRRYFVG